jgi:hypothetical protein
VEKMIKIPLNGSNVSNKLQRQIDGEMMHGAWLSPKDTSKEQLLIGPELRLPLELKIG